MLFCKLCNNLLSEVTTADRFYFECDSCKIKYQPEEKDTLRFSEKTGSNLVTFRNLLSTAGKDPVNPKVHRDCPKCKNSIAKQIRIGENMQLINTCIQCNHQWLEIDE